MGWNREKINSVAKSSAPADYAAFEAIGLSEITDACVLDIGSFDGFNTVLKFTPYVNIKKIIGLEPSKEAFNWAQSATDDKRFTWINTSLEDFTYPNNSFDIVYLSHAFQHLPDKSSAAKVIFNLLKPGGFVVIKTVDDSTKVSSPDPEHIMNQVLNYFEKEVHPYLTHVRHTDYFNGSKCYGLLKKAGYDPITVQISHTNTVGKSVEERLDLFNRMTYFRHIVPDDAPPGVKEHMLFLLEQWKKLFEQDDYYFDASTFVWIARKPINDSETTTSLISFKDGPFKDCMTDDLTWFQDAPSIFTIKPMTENDLTGVMDIEVKSFPNPWTPMAFAMELRHNKNACYVVAYDSFDKVAGYMGWWYSDKKATIIHIAVDPSLRRMGLGRTLIHGACMAAKKAGKEAMLLQVRCENNTARSFYQSLGFSDVGIIQSYYTNPDDNGIIMGKPLMNDCHNE